MKAILSTKFDTLIIILASNMKNVWNKSARIKRVSKILDFPPFLSLTRKLHRDYRHNKKRIGTGII